MKKKFIYEMPSAKVYWLDAEEGILAGSTESTDVEDGNFTEPIQW